MILFAGITFFCFFLMEEKNYTGIVPEQYAGKSIDAESSIELNSIEEAKTFFNSVKSRLQDVNNWHNVAGSLSAHFKLTDKNGEEIYRSIQEGDHFEIDIPGPGTKSGEGYDWVQIEKIENFSKPDVESFALRVRPAPNPRNPNDTAAISHFYSLESTSSFTVTREKNKVTAAIYDRNTKPNKETESLTDKVRDVVVGTAGMLSFSKIHWKALTDGLVKR
jgi:hypothetical protein